MVKIKDAAIAKINARKIIEDIQSGHKKAIEEKKPPVKEKDLTESFDIMPDNTKEAAIDLIINIKNEMLSGSIKRGGRKYQIDSAAQSAAMAFLTIDAAGVNGAPFVWRTAENENVTFESMDDFREIARDIFHAAQGINIKSWEAKDAARAAKTGKELFNAIKIILID